MAVSTAKSKAKLPAELGVTMAWSPGVGARLQPAAAAEVDATEFPASSFALAASDILQAS